MATSVCVFEDKDYKNLLPLAFRKPVYDLRCGILSIRDKYLELLDNGALYFMCRDYLEETQRAIHGENRINSLPGNDILFINGRVIPDEEFINSLLSLKSEIIIKSKDTDTIVAAFVKHSSIKKISYDEEKLPLFDSLGISDNDRMTVSEILYPWDLINKNSDELIKDFSILYKKEANTVKDINTGRIELIKPENIFIGKGTSIKPFTVIDASDGPIYIGENVTILSHTSVEGPVFIGDGSTVQMHSSVYHNTSVGRVCKIGGEVVASIIHSYSNKQHEGFLGHSYLGSWVNLGASTNNSNLKNNYGTVRLTVNGKEMDSGSLFLGLIMADHSKCSINTMFNTGTVVGAFCNIFGAGFPQKYIPSFTWGGVEDSVTYDIDKAIYTAQTVSSRRKVKLTDADIKLIRKIFDITKHERQ